MIANMCSSAVTSGQMCEKPKKKKKSQNIFQNCGKCKANVRVPILVQGPFLNNMYVPFLSHNSKPIILTPPTNAISFSVKCFHC